MLKEMLDDEIYNAMGYLVRWNNRLRHKDETNAVHTCYVVLYVDKLCVAMKNAGQLLNRAHAMSLALRHDLEEVVTGDMPRHFKANETTGALRRIIRNAAQRYLSREDYRMWRTVQLGKSREAQIVVLADWLAGLRYMLQEARLGCRELLKNGLALIAEDAKKIIKKCPNCAMFAQEVDEIVKTIREKEGENDAKSI